MGWEGERVGIDRGSGVGWARVGIDRGTGVGVGDENGDRQEEWVGGGGRIDRGVGWEGREWG